jgi:tetracycline repressor-like protein
MRRDAKRFGEWTEDARRRVGQVTAALREAQARGEVVTACEPEAVAHFLVASLEGAVLVSKLTRDPTVMQQCVNELGRYLALIEVRSRVSGWRDDASAAAEPVDANRRASCGPCSAS